MILMVKRKLLYWFKVAVYGPYHIDFIDKVGLYTGMHATDLCSVNIKKKPWQR